VDPVPDPPLIRNLGSALNRTAVHVFLKLIGGRQQILTFRRRFFLSLFSVDRLCGLVNRVPGYRSRGPSSIPDAIRFSEKYWV
jgi:hypothetical protein